MNRTIHHALVTMPYERGTGRGDSHVALIEAARRIFEPLGAPPVAETDVVLDHTSLGQPLVRVDGALGRWASDFGIDASDLHVSFTHDGDMLAALLVTAPGLRGVGVDLVHLPRLARRPASYLRALARRFMADDEYAIVAALPDDALLLEVAMRFSLMEAASKALGTGLRLGFGHSSARSLAVREITVAALVPNVIFDLGPAARARCEELCASDAEGHVACDGEYVRSEVFLWGADAGGE
jgi:phosphopantetheinyl transferase (holo-ACP synthase)